MIGRDVMIVKMREIAVLASSLSQKNMSYLKGDTLTAGSRLVAPEEGERADLEDKHFFPSFAPRGFASLEHRRRCSPGQQW